MKALQSLMSPKTFLSMETLAVESLNEIYLDQSLSTLFRNCLDLCVSSEVAKFAEDTQLIWVAIEKSPQRISPHRWKWATKCQTKFKAGKVVYISVKNPNFTYMLMESNVVERDLEIAVDSSFKVCTQCSEGVKKANSILATFKGIKARRPA